MREERKRKRGKVEAASTLSLPIFPLSSPLPFTCIPSPFSKGKSVTSAIRLSISRMTASSPLSKNSPVEVRTVEGTDLPLSLSTTVDTCMCGAARSMR